MVKAHRLTGCQVEALPVDGHLLRLLIDDGLGGCWLRDAAGAADNLSTLRAGHGHAGEEYAERGQGQGTAKGAGLALAQGIALATGDDPSHRFLVLPNAHVLPPARR